MGDSLLIASRGRRRWAIGVWVRPKLLRRRFSNPTNSAGRLAGRCLACARTGCTAWFSNRYFPISLMHFDGTHFFSGSSILFFVFSPIFFGQHHSLYYSTKKTWCFDANILLRTPSRGKMCWKGNCGPVDCFFVIAYSMYAVEVSFVLPKRPAISGQ